MSNATCPSDEDLIPMLAGETVDSTLDSHLQNCPTCRRRLDIFKSDLAALRSVSVDVPPFVAPPPRPSRIGKYLVVGSLDSGGQADVYRAVHPTLDKELAIKLSRRAVGRLSDHRPLLVAEGKLLAKLDHPGLARVYDLDFHDDLPFLAMEYVRGPNLRQYAKDVPVPSRTAAALAAEIARALAVVHRHGVVHQDVKPQNILIDEAGRPRLIDFGMARLRHAWDDAAGKPTGGTPAFMAPEQARNEDAAVGPRSDIFALGGVLYFLLTGKAPFQAESVSQTLALAGRCEFDRAALNSSGAPRGLRDICLKAMAANSADRYPRADDFAEALERYLTRPQRQAKIAGLAIAALLVIGLGYTFWSMKRGPDTAQRPQEELAALEVVVSCAGKPSELTTALPLKPDEDVFQVRARIPSGHHAVLLHINGNGKVQSLPFRESPGQNHMELLYPANEDNRGTFERNVPGTEMFIVYAAENADDLDQLEELTKSMLGRLPQMPLEAKPVWLTPDESPRQRSVGEEKRDAVATVESRLEQLRQRLLNRERKLSFFRGVAYSRQ